MEHQPVELHIQLTETDYYDFLKASYKARGIYTNLWFFGVYAFLILAMSVVTAVFTGSYPFGSLIPLAIFALITGLLFYEVKVKSRRYFHADATISKPFTLLMDEEGLELKSEISYWKLRWKELYNFMVTRKGILIYTSPVKALIIPERYLLTAGQIAVVSNLLHEHVDVKKPDRATKIRTYIRFGILLILMVVIAISMFTLISAAQR